MLNRRSFNTALFAAAAMTVVPSLARAAGNLEVNDDGLHVQPWFLESFLDLREDHAEAVEAGKNFAIVWEQKGCPYCREMHAVNFAKPEIADFIKERFSILQLNIWGSRKVTDFDGEELEERALARKWAVNFTPTTVYFPKDIPEGQSGREAEVARMPGYFKPFHFLSMYEFVDAGAYKEQEFQRFLQDKFSELEKKGKKPDVW